MGEAERIRIARTDRRPEFREQASGRMAFLGKVTSTGANLAAGKFVMVAPGTISGDETEGSPTSYDATGADPIPVYNLGPAALTTGDHVVARFQDHRWTTRRTRNGAIAGGILGNIPNCFCTNIPHTLTMTSKDENCNYKMFQSCTISWGPHPGFEPLSFGKNYYLSDQGFPDPIANGAIFYYALLCQFNQFSLTRAYLTSPYGSPFRDGVLYTWLVGGYGNTCDSFHLDNGVAFPGSDPSCVVTIDGAENPTRTGPKMAVTITPVTGAVSTVSIPDDTFGTQAGLLFAPDFTQRVQLATALTIKVIDGEDSAAPNHANRATWARNAALDIKTTATNLQVLILGDGSIGVASTDQDVFDAIQAVLATLVFNG